MVNNNFIRVPDASHVTYAFHNTCKSDEEDSGGSDSDQSTSSKGNVYNQELL